MTTQTRRRPFAIGWDALVGAAKDAAARRSARRMRKRAVALVPLSDHILRDIGLTRDNAERTLSRPGTGSGF